MTALVHTSPEGPAGQQIELLTPTTRTRSRVLVLDSSLVDNVSGVPGATVTAALDSLGGTIGALDSSDVDNVSGVPGATVTNALDSLDTDVAAVTAQLAALDSSDVANVSGVAGATVTAALNTLAAAQALPPVVSSPGWAPASLGTNALQLQPGGHPAGMYEISWVMAIRTTATGTALSMSLAWSTPTVGAESENLATGLTWANAGTLLSPSGLRAAAIMSNGVSPIVLTFNAGVIVLGNPVADLYAVARRIATP